MTDLAMKATAEALARKSDGDGQARRRAPGAGRPPGKRQLPSEVDALSALASLCGTPAGTPAEPKSKLPHRGPHKALHMRSVKAKYKSDKHKADAEAAKVVHQVELKLLADVSGVEGSKSGKAWDTFKMLRAAFTRVSGGALAQVLETGLGAPSECKVRQRMQIPMQHA